MMIIIVNIVANSNKNSNFDSWRHDKMLDTMHAADKSWLIDEIFIIVSLAFCVSFLRFLATVKDDVARLLCLFAI